MNSTLRSNDNPTWAWPFACFPDALAALAHHPPDHKTRVPHVAAKVWALHGTELGRWGSHVAEEMGIEASHQRVPFQQLRQHLAAQRSLAIRMVIEERWAVAALVRSSRRYAWVLAPSGSVVRVPLSHILSGVRDWLVEPIAESISQGLGHVAGRARNSLGSMVEAIANEHLDDSIVDGFWKVRPAPHASGFSQLRSTGTHRLVLLFVICQIVQVFLFLAGWIVLGRGALARDLPPTALWLWLLTVAGIPPFRALSLWIEGQIATDLGVVWKKRLLAGALHLDSHEVRSAGIGRLFGLILEADSADSSSLATAIALVAGTIELGVLLVLLRQSERQIALSVAVVLIGSALAVLFVRHRHLHHVATRRRLSLTGRLVECMVGHTTRLVFEGRDQRAIDRELDEYGRVARKSDTASAVLAYLGARSYLMVGVLSAVGYALAGSVTSGAIASSLGLSLLGYSSVRRLSLALAAVPPLQVAWRESATLYHAGATCEPLGRPDLLEGESRKASARTELVRAAGLHFGYRDRDAFLRGCDFSIADGDRILLGGASGAGKSTLARLLAGQQSPRSGLLLLRGLDLRTIGASAWVKSIVLCPQAHENHVFSGSLAFNLLVGDRWPASRNDRREAMEVLEEIGLRDLVRQMPLGLDQPLGEAGWRLSHGEQARLFVARALLQRPSLLIVDESFAALDATTLARTMACVRERAKTLVVISHGH